MLAEVSIELSVVFPKEAGVEAAIEAKMKPEFKALQWASTSVNEMSLCWGVGMGCRTGGCFISPSNHA